eukprot:CAMPEP_0118649434 /NCGR_PEP_ID=MMETSP0785-20121206/9702_1 /TAXON_ID=91992 /ORGANISM="Bolidomonas pacifica, Strain CCMP 1866" /LENGTH=1849 /DNA_ID=CAMNT_0006541723 /DNA_START=454 /DNA_END=6003 /DNA_ORIENTATION=-
MGLRGIISVSDLSVRNCGGKPHAEEQILLKTPQHESPSLRDVWDGLASDNSNTRSSRMGGGILIETWEKLKPWQIQHSLNITNTRFMNNQGSRGGAVAVSGTENKVFLHNNTYTSNKADISGGAVHFQVLVEMPSLTDLVGGLSVTSSSFASNSVDLEIGHGGALSVYGGNTIIGHSSAATKLRWKNRLVVSDCDFYNNTGFMGGALFATGDTTDSDPAQVSPAIIVHDASELRLVSDLIERSMFRENSAEVQGGGINVMHVYDGVKVIDSTLKENVAKGLVMCPQGDETCAGAGGGMISVYAPLTMENTVFRNNTAATNTEFAPRAGGLFAFYDTHGTLDPNEKECPRALDIKGGLFFGNVAYSKTSSTSTGGAIWVNGGASIDNSFFTGNMAASETIHSLDYNAGGAIYVQRSGAIIPERNLTDDGPIRMNNNTFTANEVKPGGYGGAIFAKGSTEISLVNQRFFRNVATSSQRIKSAGGAVAFVSGVMSELTGCYFEGNSAVPYQGHTTIIHVSGATMPMPDGLSGEAGALFLEASSSIIQETMFKNNFCNSGGSDQGASGGAVSIISFLEDTAAAYMPFFPRQPMFKQVKFISNTADSADKQGLSIADKSSGIGGAVHVLSAAPEFYDCLFYDNYARAGGSKVSLGGAVALRYAYSAYEEQNEPVNFLPGTDSYTPEELAFYNKAPKFIKCNFTYNKAVGEDSDGHYASSTLSIMQSGRGGAIGAVASMPFVAHSTFIGNSATARSRSIVPSLGGAVYLDYDSEGCFLFSNFESNTAENGAGNEVCSISVATTEDDGEEEILLDSYHNSSLTFRSCEFSGGSAVGSSLRGWPNLLIFGGTTKVVDSNFTDKSSIVVAGPGFKDIFGTFLEDIFLTYAKLYMDGTFDASKVDIFSWNADLSFSSINGTTTLDGLKVVNGTVSSSSGITVEGSAWIFGAKLCGCDRFDEDNLGAKVRTQATTPIFKATSDLTFGQPDTSILPKSFLAHYPKVNPKAFEGIFSKHVPITVDNLEILVAGTGGTGVNMTKGILSISIPLINLNNSASINIEDGGELRLETAIKIEQHINPLDIPALVSRGVINHTKLDGDETGIASLTVVGDFEMFLPGALSLELPSVADWNGPIWRIEGDALIEGVIQCTFSSEATIDEGQNWTIGTYNVPYSDDNNNPKVVSPDQGVRLSPKLNQIGESKAISIHVDNIACESLLKYHQGEQDCYVCLHKKAGCTFCGDTCQDVASASALPFGSCLAKNCCDKECSNHGECVEYDDYDEEPVCMCEWFFEGGSCDVISTSGTLVLTCGVSLTLLCLITVAYYQFHNRTKREVVENALEELRVGLLASEDNTDNGKKGSIHVGSNYIQDLQQQLLLKDVAVPIEEVNVGEEIGSGTYGVVYKGTFRGSAVAVKMVRAFGMGDAEIENFKKEAYLMSKLRHPNIVLIMGIAMKNPTSARTFSTSSRSSYDDMERPSSVESLYILSEYMERGSLADVIEIVREEEQQYADSRGISTSSTATSSNNGGVGWNYELILACALQAARGMQYLHNSNPPICHRDLKSSNLVVDDHWVVKVTDFGVSRMLDGNGEGHVNGNVENGTNGTQGGASPNNLVLRESTFNSMMTGNIGTTAWAAPEILVSGTDSYGSYSLKVDVYSFGVVLWELWERETPFKEFTSRFDMADAIRQGARPTLGKDCPEVYASLYEECVRTKPSERPNFTAIVRTLKEELTKLRGEGAGNEGGRGRLESSTLSSWFQGRGISFDRVGGGPGVRAGSKNSSSTVDGEAEVKGSGNGWAGNGSETTPIRPPYARKHSIVNNVLSSPVLSPFFPKRDRNYEELESSELDDFDNLVVSNERKSF